MNIQRTDNGSDLKALYSQSIWEKQAKRREEEKSATTIGKAAEVYISREGKKLYEDSIDPLSRLSGTDFMTDAEKQLADLKSEEAERAEYKKQASELQDRIDNDTSLTASEREDLQAQADELREKGMSDDEKLYALYDEKNKLTRERKNEDGIYIDGDLGLINSAIAGIDEQIDALANPLYGKIHLNGLDKDHLQQQVLQERAELGIAENIAKIQNAELDNRSSEGAMTTRTPEQIAAQAAESAKAEPSLADVVATAIEEGQERAEEATTDEEKVTRESTNLGIATYHSATTIIDDIESLSDSTDALGETIEKLKKMSYEDTQKS